MSNQTVRKIDIASRVVTTLAGRQSEKGNAVGVGLVACFSGPSGIACDGAGSLFIADTTNHTVRELAIATGEITTVVGSPDQSGVVFGALPAGLCEPSALAFGPTGSLFILDEDAVVVARF